MKVVFRAEGDAVQRPAPAAFHDRVLGFARLIEGFRGRDGDER